MTISVSLPKIFMICAAVLVSGALKADGPDLLLDLHGNDASIQTPTLAQGGNLLGGGLGLEWLVAPTLSLDLGFDAESFVVNSNAYSANFVDVGSHLFFPLGQVSTLWVQGSAGRNLDSENGIGNWQGQASLGLRFKVASRLAIDVAALYRYTTPSDAPIQGFGGTVGLIVPLDAPFGGHASAPTAEATPAPAPAPTAAVTPAPAKAKQHKKKAAPAPAPTPETTPAAQ